MTEAEKHEEQEDILDQFKRGLFAKNERTKSNGQRQFITFMTELKERREAEFTKLQDPVIKSVNMEM